MGTASDLQRWQRILLSVIVGVLAVTGVLTYGLIAQLRAANQNVSYQHAGRVIDADGVEIALFSRSANARGYLLSGDPVFLENRRAAKAALERHLAALASHTVGTQTETLSSIRALVVRLDGMSDRAVSAYPSSPEEARRIWEREARPIQDRLAQQVGMLVAVERAAFSTAREQAADAWDRAATLLAILLAAFAVVVTTMRDSLTGLANRAAITQIYTRERMVSAREKRPFAVALIDLDRFKSVNDTHGHASGDEVLKRTAATLLGSLRRSDAVGRWGGEELVVLLPNTEVIGAQRALDKVLADVRALEFVGKDGARFSVSFSAGAVVAGMSESLDEAIARADVLLYEAKNAGRNRVNVGS